MTNIDNKQWYFEYKEQWYGPLSREEMVMLITEKKINENTLVFQKGKQDKVQLKDSTLSISLPNRKEHFKAKIKPAFVNKRLAVSAGMALLMVFGGSLYMKDMNDQQIYKEKVAKLEKEKKEKEKGALAVKVVDTKEIKAISLKAVEEYKKEEKDKADKERAEKEAREQEQMQNEISIEQNVQQAPQQQVAQQPTPQQQPIQQTPVQQTPKTDTLTVREFNNGTLVSSYNVEVNGIKDIHWRAGE